MEIAKILWYAGDYRNKMLMRFILFVYIMNLSRKHVINCVKRDICSVHVVFASFTNLMLYYVSFDWEAISFCFAIIVSSNLEDYLYIVFWPTQLQWNPSYTIYTFNIDSWIHQYHYVLCCFERVLKYYNRF